MTDEGDRWSVELDGRDIGGHLDATFGFWSATLASRVRLVIARLIIVFVFLLDFYRRLKVIRSMFNPGALHGIEDSFLADVSLRELRTAIFKVVWSSRQRLANVGAVQCSVCSMVRLGCDPAFCVVWFRFRMLRRYLAFRPGEVPGVYRLR